VSRSYSSFDTVYLGTPSVQSQTPIIDRDLCESRLTMDDNHLNQSNKQLAENLY